MARITVEDCLKNVDNRFALIHLSAKRVRQLRKGAEPLYACKNKDIVTSLREIAAGKVRVGTDETDNYLLEDEAASAPEGQPEHAEEDALIDEHGDQAAISEEK
jgi:DNA-directed RNA polymerase subunit omega